MGSYKTNEWLLDTEAEALGLTMKAGSTAVEVTTQMEETVTNPDGTVATTITSKMKKYYNGECLEKPELLLKYRSIFPISASSGKRYSTFMAMPLMKVALERGYDSPFWITLQGVTTAGLLVKDTTAGVDVRINDTKIMTFYNACQTNNAKKVATMAYKAQFAPRSAVTGSPYPEPAMSTLSAAALRLKVRSVFWMTAKQAEFLNVQILPDQQPTEVPMNDGMMMVYNAQQTTGQASIESRYKMKR